MSKKILALAAVVAIAAAAGSAAAAGHTRHARHRANVTLHKTKLGKVLASSKGRTLYLYTPDARNKSNCYGSCAAAWPPLLTKGKPRVGAGLKKGLLGVTMRKDGKHQITYAGHPLYLFTGDSRAGQANGENYGGIWFVLNAAGHQVKPKSSSGTTTTGGGGGY